MKDNPVAWLNCLIDRGRILFVEGMDVRTPEAGIEWQGRADQLKEEAKAGVKARSPDDAARLETLSPYQRVDPPPGNPWWTSPADLFTVDSTSSSVRCEENNPLSYHLALIYRLEEIVSDWRVNPPELPIAAARRKRRVHDKPLKVRRIDWWREHRDWLENGGDERDIIEEIAARVSVSPVHVTREIRRARRGK